MILVVVQYWSQYDRFQWCYYMTWDFIDWTFPCRISVLHEGYHLLNSKVVLTSVAGGTVTVFGQAAEEISNDDKNIH